MGPDPKILDDIARIAGGAVNIASGLQQQITEDVRSRVDEIASRLDLVPREDLERAEAMITALRTKQDEMEKRIEALEKKSPAAKKTPAQKTKAKKTASKKAK